MLLENSKHKKESDFNGFNNFFDYIKVYDSYIKFKIKILNLLMGQESLGCCDRGSKIDQELIIAMKVLIN